MQVCTMLCGSHEDKTCRLPSTPQLGVMGGTSVVLISGSTGMLFLQVVMQEEDPVDFPPPSGGLSHDRPFLWGPHGRGGSFLSFRAAPP